MADTDTIDDVMAGREVPPPAATRLKLPPPMAPAGGPSMIPGLPGMGGGGLGQILQNLAPMLGAKPPNLSGSGGVPGRPVGGAAPGMPAAPTPQIDPATGRAMPQAPVPHYRDPLEALGNPLTALALIASAFVRQPATTAMSALGNAVQAQRKGDQEGYLNSYREYQQELEKVHGEQQLEMAAYKRDYDNRRLSIQESRANMRRTATKRGDSAMTTFLDSGGDPGTLLEDRAKAGKPISAALEKATEIKKWMTANPGKSYVEAEAQYKADQARRTDEAKTGTGQVGDPSLHGEAYLATLPPGLSDEIRAMGDGRMPLPNGRWADPYRRMIALYKGDEFHGQTYQARQRAENDQSAGEASRNLKAINTMIGHLGRANVNADALANTNWPAANKALNKYIEQTGVDPHMAGARFRGYRHLHVRRLRSASVAAGAEGRVHAYPRRPRRTAPRPDRLALRSLTYYTARADWPGPCFFVRPLL